MTKPKMMIVGEAGAQREELKECLIREGFEVVEFCDQSSVLHSWHSRGPRDVIISSVHDGSWDDLRLAHQIRAEDKTATIILVTRNSSEKRAIAALRAGVNDYFKWPVSHDELLDSIKKNSSPICGNQSEAHDSQLVVGNSRAMQKIKEYLPKVAATSSTVLIAGETGTGKECVAKEIHECSPRRDKPLVCINCAALPDTLLESELFGHERGAFTGAHSSYEGKLSLAEGGTVFFDEIGDMSVYAQAKVLRVIEEKKITRLRGQRNVPINFRIVAATNQHLPRLVSEGQFRKDLYFRINVARVQLPPLRERNEDIPDLIEHYLRLFASHFGAEPKSFSDEALQCLLDYDWPGNVRELKNLLEVIYIEHSSPRISHGDLPEHIQSSYHDKRDESLSERDLLLSALLSTNWNKSKAAQKLKWSRMTVYRKMTKYHIHQSQNRKRSATT